MAKLPDGHVFIYKQKLTKIEIEERELVMCRNCKHQDPDRFNDGSNRYVCRKGHGWKPDEWYCADGERR